MLCRIIPFHLTTSRSGLNSFDQSQLIIISSRPVYTRAGLAIVGQGRTACQSGAFSESSLSEGIDDVICFFTVFGWFLVQTVG